MDSAVRIFHERVQPCPEKVNRSIKRAAVVGVQHCGGRTSAERIRAQGGGRTDARAMGSSGRCTGPGRSLRCGGIWTLGGGFVPRAAHVGGQQLHVPHPATGGPVRIRGRRRASDVAHHRRRRGHSRRFAPVLYGWKNATRPFFRLIICRHSVQ